LRQQPQLQRGAAARVGDSTPMRVFKQFIGGCATLIGGGTFVVRSRL
jgi:hypothetical protein